MIADVFHTAESQVLGIVISAVVIAGAGLFYRWMKKHVAEPLTMVPEIKRAQDANVAKVANLAVAVDAVKAQVETNGGMSMSDSVNRQEKVNDKALAAVATLSEKLEGHIADDTRIWTKIERNLGDLTTGQGAAAQTAVDVAHTAEDVASDLAQTRRTDAKDVADKALVAAAGVARKTKATAKALKDPVKVPRKRVAKRPTK